MIAVPLYEGRPFVGRVDVGKHRANREPGTEVPHLVEAAQERPRCRASAAGGYAVLSQGRDRLGVSGNPGFRDAPDRMRVDAVLHVVQHVAVPIRNWIE